MKFCFILFFLMRQCDGKVYEKLESKFVKGTPSMKFHKVTLLNCISRCALNNFHTINSNADEHNEGDCHCFTDVHEAEEKSKWTIMQVRKEKKPLITEKQATRIIDREKKFCLEPESGECNPSDNTHLVYRKVSSHCQTDASIFLYDSDLGVITHACSGKRACFLGELPASEFVLHKSCPVDFSSSVWRTIYGSLQYGSSLYESYCLHPDTTTIIDGTKVRSTHSCFSSDAKFILPEYGMDAKVKMQWYELESISTFVPLNDVYNHPDFPDNPWLEAYVDNMFTSPAGYGAHYQARLTAYFLPPQTGDYKFALTVDYIGELFIGSEPGVAGKTNKTKIIEVSVYDEENSRFGFDDVPHQRSSLISLEEGKRYFLEGILTENYSGTSFMTVAVYLPNGTFIKPITAQYLERV